MSTRTDTLFPYTTLFRSDVVEAVVPLPVAQILRALVLGAERAVVAQPPGHRHRQVVVGEQDPVVDAAVAAARIPDRSGVGDQQPGAQAVAVGEAVVDGDRPDLAADRSEEHTSELQSLMRISYAVFCLQNKHTSQDYK